MTRAGTMAPGLAVAAAMLAGVLALGAAEDAVRGSTPFLGVDVEVTVWRALDGALYVGAREAGGLWRRDPTALELSATSASGRFQHSGTVRLTVPLTGRGEAAVDAVVWRSVADPARLHLSVRPEGRRWWRTVNEPLAMRAYEPHEWERYERADAVTVEFGFPVYPSASVAGPLAVFTADSGETWTDAGGWGQARDVYVLDIAADRYWRALTWPGEVATAGERLIVWDEWQVRRVGLSGRVEAMLHEGEGIGAVAVSPDGAKVAVMEEDGALTVVATATGETLLRVEGRTELAALLPDASARAFSLEGWNAASDRLAVAANALTGEVRTGIFTLEGALRLLPPNAGNLSPDFRHAIRPHGEICGYDWARWSGFDVIETESARTVRTVLATEGKSIALRGNLHAWERDGWRWRGWWAAPGRYAWYEVHSRCPAAQTKRAPEDGAVAASTTYFPILDIPVGLIPLWEKDAGDVPVEGIPAILDVASGATERPAPAEWYRLRMDAARLLARGCTGHSAQSCSLVYEGRPVWKNGVVEAVGVVDLAEPLALLGVGILESPRPSPDPPVSPPRSEWAGPLLAWSGDGGYEVVADADGGERYLPVRRVMVYDEGTGRSWRAFDYRYRDEEPAVWPARDGFVVRVGGTVRYVTPDGLSRLLLAEDRDIRAVHVSPSGGNVIVTFRTAPLIVRPVIAPPIDVTLALFTLPSGEEILRVDSGEPRFDRYLQDLRQHWSEDGYHQAFEPPDGFSLLGWSADETAFSVAMGYRYHPWGVFNRDGEFTPAHPDAEYAAPSEAPASERASVSCPDSADLVQRCAVLLDGVAVGEGRWAEAIGFVTLD